MTLAVHSNAAALWQLPWEYLHDGDQHLVLHGRFLLSRKPLGLGELQPPATPLPLHILVIIYAPDDQTPLDTEEEIGVIQAALDGAVRAGRVRVEYLDDATLPSINEARLPDRILVLGEVSRPKPYASPYCVLRIA